MKLGAIIPIRLRSERLPGKALKPICGRPVVHHLLDRVATSRHIASPRDVVVCTTTDASDDPLVAAVETYGASVFRGSVDDIIDRFHAAIRHFGFDAVIQADGDDPLSATEYMDLTMDRLLGDRDLGIVYAEGLPLGTATKSFTRQAMETVARIYKTTQNDTGFIFFFTKTGWVKVGTVKPTSPDHVLAEARLTLDYEEDFEVFRRIFEALYKPGAVFGLAEVVRFLRAHPDIAKINLSLDEGYWQRTREKAQLEYVDDRGTLRKIGV